MKIADALANVRRLFLDTAPVVYYVEANPRYLPVVQPIFAQLDQGALQAVASPVTLSECLVIPYRLNDDRLKQLFTQLLAYRAQFVTIDQSISHATAELRARYRLALGDAFQIAAAQAAGCQALLTNDNALKLVATLKVITLDDLEPD